MTRAWHPKPVRVEVCISVGGGNWIVAAEVTPENDVDVLSVRPDEDTTGEPPTFCAIETAPDALDAIFSAAADEWREQHEQHVADMEWAAEMRGDLEREERL